jgi:ribose-phosphate pyrophosphokinase
MSRSRSNRLRRRKRAVGRLSCLERGAPYVVLEKIRNGDRGVEISVPHLGKNFGRTPVLVDHIVSTGRTMIAAIAHLATKGHQLPVCVGVAVFAGDAYAALRAAGALQVMTCNTIPHESNAIDVVAPIAEAVRQMLQYG